MVLSSPYNALVTLTNSSGTTKTFSGFPNGVQDFDLIEANATLSLDGKAGMVKMLIEDSAGAMKSFISYGNTFTFKMGKTDSGEAATVIQLQGNIEIKEVFRPSKNEMTYLLTGYDKNYRLLQRIVNVHRFQKRQANGLLDPTDTSMDVANLVKYVMGLQSDSVTAITDAYEPMRRHGSVQTVAAADSIDVSSFGTAGLILPTYDADFRPVADVVKDLANQVGYIFYVDQNNKLQFTPPTGVVDSGFFITDDVNGIDTDTGLVWGDTTRLAQIIDDEPLHIIGTLEDTKNGIIGIGGNNLDPYMQQLNGGGGSDVLYNQWIAFKLTGALALKTARVSQVGVRVSKFGSPTVDLWGSLVQDKNNSPTGALVKEFSAVRSSVNPTTANWTIADCVADINTQVDHWLILQGNNSGQDSNNYYRWYNDGGTSGTIATSTDGINWTLSSNTKQYAFLIWADDRIVSMKYDPNSITNYGLRESVFSDPLLKTTYGLINAVNYQLNYSKYPKEIVEAVCFPPDTLIPLGKTLKIQDSLTGTNDIYKVIQLDYVLDGVGALAVKVRASKVFEI